MFNKALVAVAFLAASAFATPTPSEMLEKRDIMCHRTRINNSQLEACRSTLCLYDPFQGPGGYPHPFNNHEQFDFGSFTGSLFEYPLVVGTRAYNGGSPGPNRCVVAFDDVTGNCDLVGAITHNGLPPGAPPNGFIRCA